jgi:hypothetical protein
VLTVGVFGFVGSVLFVLLLVAMFRNMAELSDGHGGSSFFENPMT